MNMFDQMDLNEANEAKAKEMFFSGITDPEKIARILGCPEQHVNNWIRLGKWNQQNNSSYQPETHSPKIHEAYKSQYRSYSSARQNKKINLEDIDTQALQKKFFLRDCLFIYLSFALGFFGFYMAAEVFDYEPSVFDAVAAIGFLFFVGYSAFRSHRFYGWAGSIGSIVMLVFFFPLLFTIPFKLKKTRNGYQYFESLTGIQNLEKLMLSLETKPDKYQKKYLKLLISMQSYLTEDLPKNIRDKTIYYNELRDAVKFLGSNQSASGFPPQDYMKNLTAYNAACVYINLKKGLEEYPAKDHQWFYNIVKEYPSPEYKTSLMNMIRKENPDWILD